MPLLLPVSPETLRTFTFVAYSAVTVSRRDEFVMRSSVEVTREMESSVSRHSVDAESGDGVPMLVDLVNEDLR